MLNTIVVDAIYECDNGALYCGEHLGCTAAMTGRDISGQKIRAMSTRDNDEFALATGCQIACESCGKQVAYLSLSNHTKGD